MYHADLRFGGTFISLDSTELNELLAELVTPADSGDELRLLLSCGLSAGNLVKIWRKESCAVGRFWPGGVS